MNFKLRPYQKDLKNKASVLVNEKKSIIVQSVGGTGKTPVFIEICRSAISRGRSAIIITERTAVFNQAVEKSRGIPIGNGIKFVDVSEGNLYVAMAQTLRNRPLIIDQFNKLNKEVIVIVDECHISTANKVLDKLTNKLLLGFTATPDFRIAKHLPLYYNDIVCAPNVQWFIDNNYICDYQHIIRKSGKATSSLKKTGGDFNEQEQRKFFGTEEHYQELFRDLEKTPFKKCMLFTASIKHADEVYERMVKEGYACSIIHSKIENEKYEISKFESLNETNILISVGSLTTGYDNKDVDLIILYRATTSLALYLQMIFRADRPKEGMFFRVLDYGLNGERLKPYTFDHPWGKMWNAKPKRVSEGVGGVKTCPECDSILHVSAKMCRYCGFEIPVSEKKLEVGIQEDITNKKLQLSGKMISSLSPKELSLYANLYDKKKFAIRVARTNGQDYLKEFAEKMGYKHNWLMQQQKFIEHIGYKDFML